MTTSILNQKHLNLNCLKLLITAASHGIPPRFVTRHVVFLSYSVSSAIVILRIIEWLLECRQVVACPEGRSVGAATEDGLLTLHNREIFL